MSLPTPGTRIEMPINTSSRRTPWWENALVIPVLLAALVMKAMGRLQ